MNIVHIHAVVPKGYFVPVAWLIMAFQGKNYSHFIIEPEGSAEILDSSAKGVKWSPANKMKDHYKIVKSWTVCQENMQDLKEWSKKYEKAPYAFLQNFGAGLVYIGVWKTNYLGKDDKDLNCSELAIVFCRDIFGIDIGDSDQYDLIMAENFLDQTVMVCKAAYGKTFGWLWEKG